MRRPPKGLVSSRESDNARGDPARILLDRMEANVAHICGDLINSLTEASSGVDVTFVHAASRIFDLVVGADGIHSNVCALTLGPESDYVKYLGYYYALADLRGDTSRDDLMYNEPGRMATTVRLATAGVRSRQYRPAETLAGRCLARQCLESAGIDAGKSERRRVHHEFSFR